MHDVLDIRDIVLDELDQLTTSGYEVDELVAAAQSAAAAGDGGELEAIEATFHQLAREPGWRYVEPDDDVELRALSATLPSLPVDRRALDARMRGAWLGRAVGNTLGKPVEGLAREQVRAYLRASGQEPQAGYLPLLDPLPPGVPFLHPSAPIATAGNFTDVPRDDDIDWTILNLLMLERHGPNLTTEQILAGWLDRIPFTQTYTAERAAYRNAVHGLQPPETATHRNPYREWIGAMIRGDAFGYVSPGAPGRAVRMALADARISHTGNGLYGELWSAALCSAALVADSVGEALGVARGTVPPRSRLAEALDSVGRLHAAGAEHFQALDWVDETLGQYSWVHTLNNAAVVAVALLWGRDFMGAVGIAVEAGRDTDSTAATVGSVWGALHGDVAIPAGLGRTDSRVRSAVRDFDGVTIDELAERALRLVDSTATRSDR